MDEFQYHGLTMQQILDKARQGMIPADRAIEVPEMSEWPEDMTDLCIEATDQHGRPWKQLKVIPRPTPQWSPQIGEAVFYHDGEYGTVCRVVSGVGPMVTIVAPGLEKLVGLAWIKPFRPEAIGLPWDQI